MSERPASKVASDVVAVVLAHDPGVALLEVLAGIEGQTLRPARTIVVDNASTDGTRDRLAALPAEQRASLELLLLDQNVGVGAGHEAGWRAALAAPECAFVWSLEHDTLAEPDCLERLLVTARGLKTAGERLGVVAARGERDEVEARDREAAGLASEPFPAPRVTFNGILVTRALIEAAGFPRADFFVGFEDWEYHRRFLALGFVAVEDPRALVLHPTKGDHRQGVRPSVARSYYSTRNATYLRWALDRERGARVRSVLWAVGSLGKIVARDDRRVARVSARLVAAFDGIAGRLGRRDYWFLRA